MHGLGYRVYAKNEYFDSDMVRVNLAKCDHWIMNLNCCLGGILNEGWNANI